MTELSPAPRTFPLRLAPWLPTLYAAYLRRLSHLLQRLGRDCTLTIWRAADEAGEDTLLREILATGWQQIAPEAETDVAAAVARTVAQCFPTAIEGVTPEDARRFVERIPPIRQIMQTFPSPNVWREITAYEALHLRSHGLALLTEALIRQHGKQGELIAYDMHRAERIAAGGGKTGSVAEFIADFIAEPQEANLFTAGLEKEIVRVSEREVVLHVKECAWARYYRERHPGVGYLLACSTDEAGFTAFNDSLRMQRTSTLMEGGPACDFRLYSAGAQPEARA